MKTIKSSEKCIAEANDLINKAMREVGKSLYEKYGEDLAFPMFLHIFLCRSLGDVYQFAPNEKEADRFIKAALEEAKEHSKYGEK